MEKTMMFRRITVPVFVAGATLALSACGDTAGDRGLSGAGIGAGAGAIIGSVTPIGWVGGALIGAAAGGATGVLTTPSQVNLGKPVWQSGSSRDGSGAAAADPTIMNIQVGLQRLGYDPGPADGRLGPRTQAAIRRYEQDNGLLVDGQASSALWDHIHAHMSG